MSPSSSWTWRVGSLGGVPLRVHGLTIVVTLLLLGLGAAREGPAGAWDVAALLAIAFSAVVGHEWAHAWTARRCGLPVHAVQVGPLLNAAFLRREPDRPLDEVVVAAAGPAFNGLLAGFLALFAALAGEAPGTLVMALWINGAMAAGNLLPIFPLDGARILRGLLGLRWSYSTATRGTLWLGHALLLAGAVAGIVFLHHEPAWLVLVLLVAWVLARIGQHRDRLAQARELELQASGPRPGGWRARPAGSALEEKPDQSHKVRKRGYLSGTDRPK